MPNEPQEHPQPKIIIDDDWKTQVQAEKEALRQKGGSRPQPEQPQEPAPTQPARESAQPTREPAEPTRESAQAGIPSQLPPASFPLLVTTLATQAMAALGQLPDPIENQPVVRLELAKHYIDTLAVLEEKTKGNLSGDEFAMLEQVLHELRMGFIAVSKRR
jgi:hypothetical protein